MHDRVQVKGYSMRVHTCTHKDNRAPTDCFGGGQCCQCCFYIINCLLRWAAFETAYRRVLARYIFSQTREGRAELPYRHSSELPLVRGGAAVTSPTNMAAFLPLHVGPLE